MRIVKISRWVFPTFCALVAGLAVPASAVAPTTGKLVFTFTVTITSTLPKNGMVVCTAFASVSESDGQIINQAATGIATPSGGKATCTATMPYLWELATPGSDKILLSYHVEVDYGVEVTAANGTGTLVQLATTDKVTENLASISVPADGVTTDKAVSAIL